MKSLPRFLGSLLSASLLVAAAGCTTDDGPDSEIKVAVHGHHVQGWVLVGPTDRAAELAERLAAEMSAPVMLEGDASAAITQADTVVEVPLAPSFDPSRVDALATEYGFVVTDDPDGPVTAKADAWVNRGNRGRIARAEAPSYDGGIYDSFAIYRPSTGQWFIDTYDGERGYNALRRTWGLNTDLPLLGDYDGDGKTDTTVFRPSTGEWWIWTATGSKFSFRWGAQGDIPVPGDYDGDKVTDAAIYRNGQWQIRFARGGTTIKQLGGAGIRPVPGDYDGDGKTDLATFANGAWTVWYSSINLPVAFSVGTAADEPVPADYDGDGKTDPGVFSTRGEWLVLDSSRGFRFGPIEYWGYGGYNGDFPTRGDHDGDGKMDYDVWRPTNATFYSLLWNGTNRTRAVGASGDQPVAGPYRYRPGVQL